MPLKYNALIFIFYRVLNFTSKSKLNRKSLKKQKMKKRELFEQKFV